MNLQNFASLVLCAGLLSLALGCDSQSSTSETAAVRVVEGALVPIEVAPSFTALGYDVLGAPEGTESIHTRVFSNNPSFVPTSEELDELDNGAEIVAFIGEHAYAMHDRIWAIQRMADFPSPSARVQALGLVTSETTYAPLRCIAVNALGAYNLVTDDEVREALIEAAASSDECVRAAADAIINP